jgi:hypothetical protein
MPTLEIHREVVAEMSKETAANPLRAKWVGLGLERDGAMRANVVALG